MPDFEPLIRLRKWELDEKRRTLSVLEEERSKIKGVINQLDIDMTEAGKGVDRDIAAITIGVFLENCRIKRKQLLQKTEEKQAEINELENELLIAFQELKSIEIAAERALKREKADETRKETAAADETGMQRYIANQRAH